MPILRDFHQPAIPDLQSIGYGKTPLAQPFEDAARLRNTNHAHGEVIVPTCYPNITITTTTTNKMWFRIRKSSRKVQRVWSIRARTTAAAGSTTMTVST